MNEVNSEILSAAQQIAPNAPAVEVASAAISTVESPSPANILADIELAISLIKQFKAALANVHPSVANLVKMIF